MNQAPFLYYQPEPQNDNRQHGMFTSHPSTMDESIRMPQEQMGMGSGHPPMYALGMAPNGPAIHQPKAMAPLHSIITPAASPSPWDGRRAFFYNPEAQHLSLNTGCSTPDVMVYPSTPPLSVSGSTCRSSPSTAGILPTPITGAFMTIENLEGVKAGCEGEVVNEILGGGDYAGSYSPPLTPGTSQSGSCEG